MPDLPKISEDFTADASGYLAALQAMIDKTQELVDEVNKLHAAIDALPDVKNIAINVTGNAVQTISEIKTGLASLDGKNIDVNVTGDAIATITAIKADLNSLDNRTVVVNVVYKNIGGPQDVGAATQLIKQVVVPGSSSTPEGGTQIIHQVTVPSGGGPSGSNVNENVTTTGDSGVKQMAADLATLAADAAKARDALAGVSSADNNLATATNNADNAARLLTSAEGLFNTALHDSSLSLEQQAAAIKASSDAIRAATVNVEGMGAAEAQVAKASTMLAAATDLAVSRDNLLTPAERAVAAAALEEANALRNLDAAVTAGDAGMGSYENALKNVENAQRTLAIALDASANSERAAGSSAATLTAASTQAAASSDHYNTVIKDAAPALIAVAAAQKDVGAATAGTSAVVAAAGATTGRVVAFWSQWGTIIHWVTMLSAEFLAVAIPAMLAFGAALLVAAQAATNMQLRLTSMYTASEALGTATGQTMGQMLGLGNALQQAQNKAQPQVYELLGAALAAVKGHMSEIGTVGSQVIGIFDTFAAKVDVELQGALGAQLIGLLSKAVPDLVMFGQVIGNLGHALLNFASAMPGLAEVLLKILDVISQLILWISKLPAPLLTAVIALEEFLRWGSLLNSGIAFLIGSFAKLAAAVGASGLAEGLAKVALGMRDVTIAEDGTEVAGGKAMTTFSGFARAIIAFAAANPWVAIGVVAVAALTAFTVWAMRAKSGTDQWVASVNKAVTTAPDFAQVNTTISGLSATTHNLAGAQDVLNTKMGAWQALASGAQQNVTALKNEQATLAGQLTTESVNVGVLSQRLGVSMPQAIAIAQAAGVKLTDTLTGNSMAAQVNWQKINNLLNAYRVLGQQGSQISADINVVTIANSNQLSSVNKLNTAWQTVIGLGTGIQGSFIAFEQGLNTISNDAKVAGASFSGLNAQSLTLRNDFNNNITNMASSLGSLNTALSFGGVSWNQYRLAIASEVEAMLRAGNLSSGQVAQLGLIANAAGYTGNSYGALSQWAGKYGGTQNQLNAVMNQATVAMSNQKSMVGELQGTLQTDVINTTAQAVLSQNGFQKALLKTYDDFKSGGASSSQFKSDLSNLDTVLKSAGMNATQISQYNKALITSWSQAGIQAKQTAGQTGTLNDAFGQNKIAADGLRDEIKNVFIAIGHTVETIVDQMKSGLLASLSNLWGAIESIFKVGGDLLTGNWKGAWNALVGVITNIGGMILNAAKAVFAPIENLAKTIWDALPASWRSTLVGAFTTAWSAVSSAVKTAFDTLAHAVPAWMSTIGNAITTAWKTAWQNLSAPVVQAFDSVKNAITSGFDGWWKTHGSELEQVWNTIWTTMKTVAQQAVGSIESIASGFWNALTSSAHLAWGAIGGDVKLGWSLITSTFNAGAAVVKGVWDIMWAAIETTAKTIWAGIQAAVQVGWALIEGVFKTGIALITGIWNTFWAVLKASVTTVWAGIEAVMKIAWDTIVAIFSVALDLITGHWHTAWVDIQNYGTQVWNAIKSFFSTSWNAWKAAWDTTLSAMQSTWNTVWNAIKSAGTTIWNAINGFFTSSWNNFRNFTNTTWNDVKTTFTNVWNAIKGVVETIWNAISSFFNSAWNTFRNLTTTTNNDVKNTFTTVWTAIKNFLVQTWDAISSFFTGAWNTFRNLTTTTFNDVKNTFTTIWNAIKSTVETIWNAISSFFNSAYNTFKSLTSSTFNSVASTISSVWNSIKNTTTSVWNSIMSFFNTIWTNIKNGFTNVVNTLGTVWTRLEGIFKTPVSFLVNTVYDGGIARFWNDVMGFVGGPKLPTFTFAAGGKVPGGFGGGDIVPAMLEPGEAIVPKHLVSAVAPFLGQHGVPGFAAGGYVNPLPAGYTVGRIDQGVDFLGTGPIKAIGNARIVETSGAGWPGGPYMAYQLTSGPDAGRYIYVAENIKPTVSVGQTVTAGQTIANMFNGGVGIEMGWAAAGGASPLSQTAAAGSISGANLPLGGTAVGHDFDALLTTLGVQAAPNFGIVTGGKLPAGMGATSPSGSGGINLSSVFGSIINGVFKAITGTIAGLGDAASILSALATGNTTALANAMSKVIGTGGATGALAQMMTLIPKTLIKDAVAFISKYVGAHTTNQTSGGLAGGTSTPLANTPGNIVSWITQAIKDTGVPASWLGGLEIIAKYESGDNPNAINLTDSNAKAGDPSRGLMQTIMTTFTAYHQAGTSNNIYDPVANVAAAINYIKARYGTVSNVPGVRSVAAGGAYVGYDAGGLLMPGLTLAYNGTGKPERITSPLGAGGGGSDDKVIHSHIYIDGKKVFESLQPYVYQYNSRNSGNGNVNGTWKPL